MTNRAKIISTDGKIAEIEVERRTMCDGCEKKSCSGGCSVSGLVSGGKMRTRALNGIGAVPGDTVEVESSDSRILSLSLLVFIFPIVICILFYVTAERIGFGGGYAVISAAVGFVLSFVIIGIVEKSYRKRTPDITVVAVVEHEGENK